MSISLIKRIVMKKIIICLQIGLILFSIVSPVKSTDLKAQKPYDWKVATPGEQDIDPDLLSEAFDEVRKKPYYYSLLVVKNGYLVAEEYFNGHDMFNMDVTHSVTKNFLSALIGIAIEKGLIDSLNQKFLDFFPEYMTADLEPRKKDITIKHLISMQSGFETEDKFGLDVFIVPNLISFIINSELRFNPGTKYLYSSHGSHLLSGILTKASSKGTYDFARKHLFRPIGIKAAMWEADQNNISHGGAGLILTPRDMARFGYLYLKKGKIDNKQIVPADWIKESTKNQRDFVVEWNEIKDLGYGYLWWNGRFGDIPVYFASGIGGQWILNIPVLDMVIVATMNTYTEKDWQQGESFITIVDKYILPAVMTSYVD